MAKTPVKFLTPSSVKLSAKPTLEFKKLLLRILSKPTSPFCESWIQEEFKLFFREHKLPYYEDAFGNLWLGVSKSSEIPKTHLLFVAHMDHPGFAINRWTQKKKAGNWSCEAKWFGGGPTKILGHRVKVFPTRSHPLWKDFQNSDIPHTSHLKGRITHVKPGTRSVATARIEVPASALSSIFLEAKAPGLDRFFWGACLDFQELDYSGTLSFATGGRLRTKSADDLVGGCLAVQAFLEAREENTSSTRGVAVLLSRAEENGFHGTLAALRSQKLNPRYTVMVSIETSSQLPGAELGKGPVIRLGDRATIFSPYATRFVQSVAGKLPKLKFQRRVMDGGSCEATAFNSFHFEVAGISIPLGGYHNVGKDLRAIPEEVSLEDVLSAKFFVKTLMQESRFLTRKTWRTDTFKEMRKNLLKSNDEYLKMLRDS